MLVKVINRADPSICNTYANVDNVVDVFDDNRNFCHQIQIGSETATFPACEWEFFKLDWVRMF